MAAKRSSQNDAAMMYADWAYDFLRRFQYDDKRTLHYHAGAFWLWTQEKPWYRRLTERSVWNMLWNWMVEQKRNSDPDLTDDLLKVLRAACHLYVDAMPCWLGEEDHDLSTESYVTMRNGILNLGSACADPESAELFEHDPNWFSPTYLNYAYEPSQINKAFESWMRKRVRGEAERKLIQEYAGYILTSSTHLEVALFLQGVSGTGKSTLARVLTKMVGDENTACVPLSKLADQFVLTMIQGKSFLWSDEVEQNLKPKCEEVFKMLVSGSRMPARDLYQSFYDLRPNVRILATFNEWPRLQDSGSWRRIMLVKMTEEIKREKFDHLVEKSLMSNMSGVFNWALEGLRRLQKQGWFTRSEEGEATLSGRRADVESELCFVQEHVKESERTFVLGSDLYRRYIEYCKDNGYKARITQRALKELVLNEVAGATASRQAHGRGIRGIKLLN